jgi:hypothetical protein
MSVDKHMNFFELQKASEKPGCPLCRIVNDREEWYIDNLLFEHVADRGFRALHRAAGGFCSYHSRGLVSFRDGLAVAILSRDILEDRLTTFEKKKPWQPKGRCPICLERERIEEEYLSFLANAEDVSNAEVQELKAVIEASEGLCAPHYAGLLFTLKGKPRKVPQWLREFHETKYRDLLKRVSQFIEFSAYGRQKEFAGLSEKDQLVWKEAAAALRGSTE